MAQKEQMVRHYSGPFKNSAAKKFAKDAEQLALEGWTVQSQSATGGKPYFTNVLTVVYERQKERE